jgi:NAD(P)H-hydrate epimerase
MREWEKATWSSGVKEEAVMRRAGQAIARAAESLTRQQDRVLFLAGKGHNGDDALFAREYIQARHTDLVRVVDPAIAASELSALLARKPALIVDGLFGIGLTRPLSPDWIGFIDRVNACGCPVLSVDVPSGLDAATGATYGTAIRARRTVTLGAAKIGLLAHTAWDFVGQLEIAPDIGLVPCPFESDVEASIGDDFVDFPPPRSVSGHKGSFGHLTILAGSRGFHGAAILAARGAQRAQPGLITLSVPESVYVPIAAQLQAVMVQPASDRPRVPEGATAILTGPGLAATDLPQGFREFIRELWQNSKLPVIADASALDWLPAGEVTGDSTRIITPHPGEAARMLGLSTSVLQSDRPGAVRVLSTKFGGCHVVLKGHQTLVGGMGGCIGVNLSGNPWLAQGGSGDLLSGYLAGLVAQPVLNRTLVKTARFAVWQHGAAGDALLDSKPHFTIEDLADALGSVRPERRLECDWK